MNSVMGITAPFITGLIVLGSGSFSSAFVVAGGRAAGRFVSYIFVLGPIELVDRPGLGVEIDLEEAAKYSFQQESVAARDAIRADDRTVARW